MRTINTSVLVLGFFLTANWFASADEGKKPAPKLTVGKDTTYITGPLDKDGYIDYETALNQRLSEGIKPETNANVLIVKALGPKPEGRPLQVEFYQWLGIEAPPEDGDYFIALKEYLRDHLKLDQSKWEALLNEQTRAVQRPWTAKDYPHFAEWLKANEKPMALIVEASKRPEYYNPLVSPRTANKPRLLINALLSTVQPCRELATALTARAMLSTGEGRVDEAWRDLLACHRLARLIGHGSTLIEALVGFALDGVASNADLAFLENGKLTEKQVRARLQDLQALPPLPSIADKIDLGERFWFLEAAQHGSRNGIKCFDDFTGETPRDPDPLVEKFYEGLDWTPVFRKGNRFYDRVVATLHVKNRPDRERELLRIDEEIKAMRKGTQGGVNFIKQLLMDQPRGEALGEAVGDIFVCMMMPGFLRIQKAADGAEQRQRNLHLAFALAAYHSDNGRYPEKLDALAPKYLARVPDDLFTGEALIYRPSENGYLLYSIGVNGLDEGGQTFGDDPAGDDPRVRMPLPELKGTSQVSKPSAAGDRDRREGPPSRLPLILGLAAGAALLLIVALVCVRWRKRRTQPDQDPNSV